MRSQIITGLLCLSLGFGVGAVLFANTKSETAVTQAGQGRAMGRGNRQGDAMVRGQRGQGRAGHRGGGRHGGGHGGHGGHGHGGHGAAAAKQPVSTHVEKVVAQISRAFQLDAGQRDALRLSLLKQNYATRRALDDLQALIVRFQHLDPSADQKALLVQIGQQATHVATSAARSNQKIFAQFNSAEQKELRRWVQDKQLYFYWLGN